MMQIQLPKVFLDVPDGLYLQKANFKTQDIFVDPSGVHHHAIHLQPIGLVKMICLSAATQGNMLAE